MSSIGRGNLRCTTPGCTRIRPYWSDHCAKCRNAKPAETPTNSHPSQAAGHTLTASIGATGAAIHYDNKANHPLSFRLEYRDPALSQQGQDLAALLASAPTMARQLAEMERCYGETVDLARSWQIAAEKSQRDGKEQAARIERLEAALRRGISIAQPNCPWTKAEKAKSVTAWLDEARAALSGKAGAA